LNFASGTSKIVKNPSGVSLKKRPKQVKAKKALDKRIKNKKKCNFFAKN